MKKNVVPVKIPEKDSVNKEFALQEENPVVSLGEAREALIGIPSDLLAGRGSLYQIITRNNRLRGIGIVLVIVALTAAVLGLFRS